MTADDLRAAGMDLFGPERGWQTRMAEALKVDRASVTRWLAGGVPVPGPVSAAIECWQRSGVPTRPVGD